MSAVSWLTARAGRLMYVTPGEASAAQVQRSARWQPMVVSAPGRGQKPKCWDEAVQAWLENCRAANRSPETLRGYARWLLGPRLAQARGGEPWPECLGRETLIEFLVTGRRDGLKPSSLLAVTARVKAFARWCIEMGWATEEEASLLRVRNPTVPKTLPEVLSQAQVTRLLRAARTARDRMIVRFLLGTGLRLSECASVTLDDLAGEVGEAMVRVRLGKGGKDRYTPLGLPDDPLWQAVQQYVEWDRPVAPDSRERHLWLRERKVAGEFEPMSPGAIWGVVSGLSSATGIRVWPHLLRHTWATRAIAAGVPTEIVRRAGGWADLQVMQRYLHVSDQEMLRAWHVM
jgi:integrase/recombinase XerD